MNAAAHPLDPSAVRRDGGAPMRLARAGLAAIAVALAGCSTTPGLPGYVEPGAGQPTAKLRIVNTRPAAYYATMATFDGTACLDRATVGMTGGDSKDTLRVGMADAKPSSPGIIERRVAAGEPLVVGPRAVFPTASVNDLMHAFQSDAQNATRARQAGVCRVPRFIPKAGEQYEVVVDLSPAHCSIKPYRLIEAEGRVQREEMPAEPSRISTFGGDMKCFK
jgi:hypothetical protein